MGKIDIVEISLTKCGVLKAFYDILCQRTYLKESAAEPKNTRAALVPEMLVEPRDLSCFP
jgi:hypothetical protein